VFIVHGEPDAADALRVRIERELGWSAHVPEYLERVELPFDAAAATHPPTVDEVPASPA
jgi:hypothetical protein